MATQSARQEKAAIPHDTYAKKVFSQLPQARAFFRAYLPDDVQALFDWRTLRVESVSFISDELQRRFADLRFTIRLIGTRSTAASHCCSITSDARTTPPHGNCTAISPR